MRAALVIFACLISLSIHVVAGDETLKSIFIDSSSPYETGFEMGKLMKPNLDKFLDGYDNLQQMIDFVEKNQEVYYDLYDAQRAYYPQYVDEVRGIADALNISFETLFIISISPEIALLMRNTSKHFPADVERGCSDVMLKTLLFELGELSLGHNEDMGPLFKNLTYLVSVHQQNLNISTPYVDRFSAFVYIAHLPGNAFGWNAYGMGMSTNEIFPKEVYTTGLARYYINRDLLNSASIDDAIARATVPGKHIASGFSFNILSVWEERVVNIEVGPGQNDYNIFELNSFDKRSYNHFNMYKRLSGSVPAYIDNSTLHRQAAVDRIGTPATPSEILRILGDTSDKEFPMYRNGSNPDYYSTMATVLYDGIRRVIKIYRGNPFLTEPIYQFPFELYADAYANVGIDAYKISFYFFIILFVFNLLVILVLLFVWYKKVIQVKMLKEKYEGDEEDRADRNGYEEIINNSDYAEV